MPEKTVIAITPVAEVRRRGAGQVDAPRRHRGPHEDKLSGVLVRQGFQQNGVDHGEDRGVGPDAES